MELVKLDVNRYDLNLIAGLIYETDSESFEFYFKNKQNAVNKIKKLIEIGKNNLGHENIYVVTNEEDQIHGILVISIGEGYDFKHHLNLYFKTFNFLNALKFILFDFVDQIFLAKLDEDDLYLASVAVDYNCRGKGLGKFILKKSLEIAKKNGSKRAVLDVDIGNEVALNLYKKFGFKVYNKKILPWIGGNKGVYNMEYNINGLKGWL
ncbi:MAG: GNAT family N-acetyltransferase [Methanobacterium sp.]|nr:GNAT family N-acetyltransferase [Methanobacterium sp.]